MMYYQKVLPAIIVALVMTLPTGVVGEDESEESSPEILDDEILALLGSVLLLVGQNLTEQPIPSDVRQAAHQLSDLLGPGPCDTTKPGEFVDCIGSFVCIAFAAGVIYEPNLVPFPGNHGSLFAPVQGLGVSNDSRRIELVRGTYFIGFDPTGACNP
jgi:hypothetical protein